MRHIDKASQQYKTRGEQIVTDFLHSFIRRKGCHPADMYKAFYAEIDDNHQHIRFRQRLIDDVLQPEQQNLCCYCMRTLAPIHANIEHVMRNHASDDAELSQYRVQPTPLDGIPHPNTYKQIPDNTHPPHPHAIAYQNLVLSCNGILINESKPACCNLKRQNKFLYPFILYRDIAHRFEYLHDGTANWIDDPEPFGTLRNSMRVLGLNHPVLKTIRRIHFFCTEHGLDYQTTPRSVIINEMLGHLSPDPSNQEANHITNFKQDKYWQLLEHYHYFSTITPPKRPT